MGKPLVNTENWARTDIRMLIILQFIIVYPILAGSLFMVLLFFALPRETIWPHVYWLITTGAWVLLLAIIMPLMRDQNVYRPTGTQKDKKDNLCTGSQHEPVKKAKDINTNEKSLQVSVSVEKIEMGHYKRASNLSNRSSPMSEDRSSDDGENRALDENLKKSIENMQKSSESIGNYDIFMKRGSLMQSGDFLNDLIGNFGDDNKKQDKDDVLEDDTKKQEKADGLEDDNQKQDKAEMLDDDNKKQEITIDTKNMNGVIDEGQSDKSSTDAENDNKGIPETPSIVVDKQLCQDDGSKIEELSENPSPVEGGNLKLQIVDKSLNCSYKDLVAELKKHQSEKNSEKN
ncbi:unnamed protein product [Meganyctiphanes norvegica]|uniref:Uncharacterized protein n=1 Tax=Meganyctiphanes norvegica TaxID=48144 RepID=A0AAV2S9R6_MEGNR